IRRHVDATYPVDEARAANSDAAPCEVLLEPVVHSSGRGGEAVIRVKCGCAGLMATFRSVGTIRDGISRTHERASVSHRPPKTRLARRSRASRSGISLASAVSTAIASGIVISTQTWSLGRWPVPVWASCSSIASDNDVAA